MTQAATMTELTPAFKAMTPLQKWETLVLSGLIGTDEPWIEDMRQALREQETALQGPAALPSEATLGVGDGSGQLFVHGSYEAIKRVRQMIFDFEAMRAATAPVQDDDAELVRLLRLFADAYSSTRGMPWIGTVRPEQAFTRAADRIERLSPTPDTGLIEALIARVIKAEDNVVSCGCCDEEMHELRAAITALANAAPAQVESKS